MSQVLRPAKSSVFGFLSHCEQKGESIMKLYKCTLALLLGLAINTLICAEAQSATVKGAKPKASEVSIPNTRKISFISKVNGHRYSVTIALPFTPAPKEGYGVLYVLDGYWFSASATEAVRMLATSGVTVVGIGYPEDSTYTEKVRIERGPVPTALANLPISRSSPFLERIYDLTLPASDRDLATQTIAGTPQERSRNVGGLDDFLRIIETEIKPRVAALAPIDTTNQALFGASLGGLATLHALFVEPNAFRTFIIASPSIWWNNKEVLADEAKFDTTIRNGEARPRVLITVGSEEDTPVKLRPSWGINQTAYETYLRKVSMVQNAQALAARLNALRGGPGYTVEGCAVFDKEGHGEAAWSALARGIPFAFPANP
jgi:hypothetical protein